MRAIGCAALLAVVYAFTLPPWEIMQIHHRAVEIVIPFLFGLQAALIFAPDDEPALEVLLACPRPAAYIILERAMTLTAMLGGIALLATVVNTQLPLAENIAIATVRWLVPSLLIGSAALYLSLAAGRANFGLLLSIVMCLSALVGGDYIVGLQPGLWFAHPYLRPDAVTPEMYAVNRLFLLVIAAVVFVRALTLSRDEARLLNLH
jgi:hypothetical protein